MTTPVHGTNRNLTGPVRFHYFIKYHHMLFHHNHNFTMVGTLRKDKPHTPEITATGRKKTHLFLFFTKTLHCPQNKSKKIGLVQSGSHQESLLMPKLTLSEMIYF